MNSITKWIFISILSTIMKPEILIHGQQQVPCLFFFGDSLFENGNNNNLITIAKSNYPPYGIDFPGGIATGRPTNGRNVADFLAQYLGFDNPIPPSTMARGPEILKGVNYASGGSGILDETGADVGQRYTLNEQLKNHGATIELVAGLLGNRTSADNHLRQCLYVISTGNDDYINNYYLPLSPTRLLYTPDMFAQKLIKMFSQQLRTLYNLGPRKIAVFGAALVGCLPRLLSLYPRNGSGCVDFINNAVQLYDNRLISLIQDLNNNLPGARFTYLNITDISSGVPSATGIKVVDAPCCEVNIVTGLCVRNGDVCSNRDEYAYFNNYHPTQILFNFTATKAYTARSPTDAIPVDIRTLARQ